MKKVCVKDGLCCARILMAALAALAPLSMNIQSDALPMHCHTQLGITPRELHQ